MVTEAPPSVNLRTTKVFKELLQAWAGGKRRCLLEGGTYSSKTWSALQFLQVVAEKAPKPLLISVVSESLPHLRQGAIKDFFVILGESPDSSPYWSKTLFTYKRPGWKGHFEFFGTDNEGKAQGPRREVLFINQGENVPWGTAHLLDDRTELFTIVDWNPTGEFWAHEQWVGGERNAYSHSTYLDALPFLSASKREDIEDHRDKDPNWWNIYGLGLLGKIEGLVYSSFEQVDELPLGLYFYGLDYGFMSDPTVLVKNVLIGDRLYSQQMFYDLSGLTNGQIAQKMSLLGIKKEPIYADPNEPKSAEELRQDGFNMQETVKGQGSVSFGIQKVNNWYQHWTKDSLECIKEQRNHRYIKDRVTGLFTDRTTHQWSHGMDSRRYAVATYQEGSKEAPKSKHSFRL